MAIIHIGRHVEQCS